MNHHYEKEWMDESGYCNCLLVAMSRVKLSEMELSSNQQLPNLEELVSSRESTSDWIKAQEINYKQLDSEEVIKILMKSADMSRMPWGKKKGAIHVIDLEGAEGPEVERVFRLKFSKTIESSTLKIELDCT